ncbi:HypC/HybG/HupF family hydrogenase formation chaperone [Novosphingobium naphthalenivorans]|uniref:HypC/HybG/HupF family hydrogenase formation chaperone n=1 Tax=Novosphingobium naphthalenivorans TaxID=273168 RepID=UPI000831B5C4|nr:HypC/HybG/HupF family hydrogenase formation chaperone [Novosphingobium naphthalenivorans]
MCLAVPGELLEVIGDGPLTREGRVAFAGVMRRVNLAYVPEASPGDYVLVHAGFAIAVIDEAEAHRTLALLDEIGPETGR